MPFIPRKKRTTTYKKVAGKPKGKITRNVVAKIAKAVTMKQIETKKHSVERIEIALSTIGGVEDESLVSIGTGNGQNGRDGHMLQPVGLDVRGHINTNVSNPCIYKVMAVLVKNNEADPATDFLETNTGNVDLTTGDVSTLYRRVNTDSYKVLASRLLKIGPETDQVRFFNMWIDMKKYRKFIYEGAGTSEPLNSRIHLIAFGRATGNDAFSVTAELHYVSTFYFKDA